MTSRFTDPDPIEFDALGDDICDDLGAPPHDADERLGLVRRCEPPHE